MKPNWIQLSLSPLCTALLSVNLAASVSAGTGKTTTEFPVVVPVEAGLTEFAPGDSITIQRVTGTSSTIRTGETYCVEGTYTLSSKAEAVLALFTTTTTAVSLPTDPSQTVRIKQGSGTFHLVKRMREDGYLHVSFYPVPGGSSLGGVYFGQGEWLLPKEGWSAVRSKASMQETPETESSSREAGTLVGANRAMFKYLGEPVAPPADMAEAYTKEGLIKAIHTAASKAGVSVIRVEIEDSEYPFLIGLICRKGEFYKVADELRKMPDYDYCGCTSTPTHSAFNMVPYRVFPPDAGERISHRTGLRTEMFFHKLMSRDAIQPERG